MYKREVMKKKEFDFAPMKKLIIGDPDYLESIEKKENVALLKRLVCKVRPKNVNYGKLIIEETKTKYPEFEALEIEITFLLGNTQEQIGVYESNRYYSHTVYKKLQLACDCAEFIIETEHGYDEFRTGADGYYGDVMIFKQGFGLTGNISLDGSLFDFDDVIKTFKYLFNIKDEN